MSEELRYDQATIEIESEQDGFLRAKVFLSKPGVYPYLLSDGSLSREAKLEEELFSSLVIDSAKAVPVTDGHPTTGFVDSSNFQTLVKGSISNPRVERNFLVADEVVYDRGLISSLQLGEKREVSIGFRCDIETLSGEFEGKRYDKVQRNIRINHVAHVEKGNAGPDAKIQLDSKQSFGVMSQRSEQMADAAIDPASANTDAGMLQKIYDMLTSLFKKEESESVAIPSTSNTTTPVQVASMQAELAVYKNKVADLESKLGEMSGAKLDQAIESRISILKVAKDILPDMKFDSKNSNLEIQKLVLDKLAPNTLKADASPVETEAYYNAFLKIETEKSFKREDSVNPASNRIDEKKIAEIRSKRLKMKEEK